MIPEKLYYAAIMEPGKIAVHEMPMPELKADQVLIKVEKINICTTDYQQWAGLRNHQPFPMAAGHEFVGTIAAKGEAVHKQFQIGDRVSAVYESCNVCSDCRHGNTSDCKYKELLPIDANGFHGNKRFATYTVTKQSCLVKVASDIPAEQAAFIEPVATVVQGVKKAKIAPMEDVVVIGAGTMGLLNAQVAKAWGARVIISDIDPKKIARAKEMNIAEVIDSANTDVVEEVKRLTDGKGADCVIAAVGSSIAYKQALSMLKPLRGRFILFPAGYPEPEMDITPNYIHYHRTEIIGTVSANVADWEDASRLISKKLINTGFSLEGKEFALRDIQDAFAAAATPGTYRITVNCQEV